MSNRPSTCIEPVPSGIVLHVYVAPRSSSNKVLGLYDGMLKIALTAPPVEGAANKALVEFVAKLLGVSKSSVALVTGETSRKKTLRVEGVKVEDALSVLLPKA